MAVTIKDVAKEAGVSYSTAVSYTHLDVYKRQYSGSTGHAGPFRYGYYPGLCSLSDFVRRWSVLNGYDLR